MAKGRGIDSGGGPAAAGGFSFQAAVTALTLVHSLRGIPLGWLDGLISDAPTIVESESGGGGDDLRLTFERGVAEVQIKKGLRADTRLWVALDGLVREVAKGAGSYGVLLVSPDSSSTVRRDLAGDLHRLGDGLTALTAVGMRLADRLVGQGHTPASICGRMRIVTAAADGLEDADVRAARALLGSVCVDSRQVAAAWDRLYRQAHAMQAGRRSCTRVAVARVLRSAAIGLHDDPQRGPSATIERLCRWTADSNATFEILGVDHPLSIDAAFIELATFVPTEDAAGAVDAGMSTALAMYRDWGGKFAPRDAAKSVPQALGRFYRHAVLVAGPGAGKSTLMAKLARAYALDGFPVLKVSALALARRMARHDETFEEALFTLALAGSGVAPNEARGAGISEWVVLVDGLDEAGQDQAVVTDGLTRLIKGNPQLRAVVTTRPVGYRRAALATWRHYELTSIARDDVARRLAKLLEHVLGDKDSRRNGLLKRVERALEGGVGPDVLQTPLMLGLAAALFASGGPLGGDRADFYRAVIAMMDEAPPRRAPPQPSTQATRLRVFDLLGMAVTDNPAASAEVAVMRCAEVLQGELGIGSLAARGQVEECAAYWEALGILERLRQSGEQAFAFVHKTLGEFGAGRWLAQEPPEALRAIVTGRKLDPNWRESLMFAAMLGAGPLVLEACYAEGLDSNDDGALLGALEMLAAARPTLPASIAEPLLTTAFDSLQDDRPETVAAIGIKLAPLGKRYGALILPRSRALYDHPQTATRLAAAACCFVAGPDQLDIAGWARTLPEFAAWAPGGEAAVANEKRRAGSNYRQLLQVVAEPVAERIIAEFAPPQAQALLEENFKGSALLTVGFIMRLERQISAAKLRAWWFDGVREPVINPATTARLARLGPVARASFGAIGDALQRIAGVSEPIADRQPERPLFVVSGFLEVMGLRDVGLSDVWELRGYATEPDVLWVWGKTAEAAGLPFDRLADEAAAWLAMTRLHSGDALSEFFKVVEEVDVPAPDWSSIAATPDVKTLVQALRRSSAMVVEPALAIATACEIQVRRSLCEQLWRDGAGETMAVASRLTATLPESDAIEMLGMRLESPMGPGAEYVIEHLAALAPNYSRRNHVLGAALLGDWPFVAQAAAAWAVERPQVGELPLLIEAFDHWRDAEGAMPSGSGIVPPSPRSMLLTARFALEAPSWNSLAQFWSDDRNDVRQVALQELLRQLRQDPSVRSEVAQAVASDELPTTFFRTIAAQTDGWAWADIEPMLSPLEGDDPERRQIAISLLASPAAPRDKVVDRLRQLRRDPDEDIREKAATLLRTLTSTDR